MGASRGAELMTIYTLPIALSTNIVTKAENSTGLNSLDSSGLHLSTGGGFYDNISYTPFDTAPNIAFPLGQTLTLVAALGGSFPTTLTTALFNNISLVPGTTLTVTYNYNSTEATSIARTTFGEARANDFAFAILGSPTATTQYGLLARTDIVTNGHFTADSTYTEGFTITKSGVYSLLIGNADVGDTNLNSTLTIKSITITAPDTIFQQTPTGITFQDGSQYLLTGQERLADGRVVDGVLSAGSTALLNAGLLSLNGAGIVSHDAGGIVSHDAGGIVSHDAGGLISQDGGNLISQDGGGLISQDGGGLLGTAGIVSHDAGGVVSNDGGSLISQDGGGLISQDGGGLVATGGGNAVATRALLGIDSAPPAILPVRIGGEILVGETAPSFTHQNNPSAATLTTGQFVVAWSSDNTTSGHFEIRAQVLNADGSKAAPSFLVSTLTTSDQITPSVAALADGHFAVSWRGPAAGAADLHTQIFDGLGAKIGSEIHVGASGVNETAPDTAELTGGGFVTVFESTISGTTDSNAGLGRLYGADGTAGAVFGFGSTSDPTTKSGAAVTALQGGGFAVAYREINPAATAPSDQDGIYLDVYAADGTRTLSGIAVNTKIVGIQSDPAIATLADGDIVVSWIDAGASSTSIKPIRAQIFHPTGYAFGGEILVGNTLSGSDAPTITALSDGRFGITYDATSQRAGIVTGLNLTTQFFTADGTISGTPLAGNPVSLTDAYREQSPTAIQLGTSEFAVVGMKTNGGTSTIQANLFDLAGTGATPVSATDLKVTTTFLDRSVAGAGDTINVSYQVKNAGSASAGASTSKIYLSDDATITSSDRLIGTLVDPALGAGNSVSDTIDIVLPSDLSRGVHYIGVIADANGQVAESNEANNVSAAVTFGPPARLSGSQVHVDTATADTHNASQSYVTALSNGNYVVTWVDSDETGVTTTAQHDIGQIFTAAGARVGGPFDIETFAGGLGVGNAASVSALADGKFVATWSQNDYVNGYATYQSTEIHAQIFNADGTRAGSEIVVDPGISNPVTKFQFQGGAPDVTTLSDGRFLVTYNYAKYYDHSLTLLDDQTTGLILGRIYNADGSSAGPAFQASTSAYVGNPTYDYHPVVASLAGGGFVVTYQGSDYVSGSVPAYSGILAQIYDSSAHAVGSEFIVNSQHDYDQDFQDVVGLTNGDFVVTWRDLRGGNETVGAGEDPSGDGVYGQVMTATGQRVGGQFLVNTTTPSDQGLAKVAALPDGLFVVTWTDSSGASGDTHADIRAQVFNPDGTKSGAEFIATSLIEGVQQFPSIAALTNDDVVIAWEDGYTTYPSHQAIDTQTITFSAATTTGPDLTVTSASLGAHAATAGSTVHIAYTINNVGDGDAGISTSKVYISTSAQVTSADRVIATMSDAVIQAGHSTSDSFDIVLPTDLASGSYHLAVIADATDAVAESNETNNASTSPLSLLVSAASPPVVTPPSGQGTPDLAFFHGANDVTLANAVVTAGDTDTISYYAVNNGTGNAPASHTGVYLSTDPTLTAADTRLTLHDTPALFAYTAGQNYAYETVPFTIPANLPPGTYYVGAIADDDGAIGESSETDNVSSAVQLTVAAPPVVQAPVQAPVVLITGSIAGDDVIDSSDAARAIAISGTASHLDDGSFVTVSVKDAAGHVLGQLSTPVSAGIWGLSLAPGLLNAAANGAYTVEATASNAGGASVADHAVTLALDATPVGPSQPQPTPVDTGALDTPQSSPPPVETPPTILQGKAIDGYLAGAIVFADANGNGSRDAGEASATTDASGSFTLVGGSGTLVAQGGVDIATGLAFTGTLTAPAGSSVVTPLTTLVVALAAKGVADPLGAAKAAFGLPSSFDLLRTDPVAAAAAGDASALTAIKAGAAVADTLALISAGLKGAGASAGSAAVSATAALAGFVASGGSVDLTSAGTVTSIAKSSGLSADVSSAIGGLAALSNAKLAASADASSLAAIQNTAQGSSAAAVEAAGSDMTKLAAIDSISTSLNHAPVAVADAVSVAAHAIATGTVLANDSDADRGDILHVTSVRFAGGHDYVVAASGTTVLAGEHGTLQIAADGHYTYVASSAGGDAFAYTLSDGHGTTATARLDVTVAAQAPAVDTNFNFAFADAKLAFSGGEALLTGPDGVAHDVTGIGHLHFTDGTIDEADGAPLVDDLFYFAHNRDVWQAHLDPDQHYAQYGGHEGRDPNPIFSTEAYLAANPDVRAAGLDPVQHYDQYGWHEGRSPGPGFSAEAYLAMNPDVKAAGLDPMAHYLAYGQAEGRTILPGESVAANGHHLYGVFDADFYLATNKDVAAAAVGHGDPDSFAFTHYLTYGAGEGRNPDSLFSTKDYVAANPDVAAAGLNPLLHYEAGGWQEGRNPSAAFDANGYLAANPDVAAAHMDPLQHFLEYGAAEARHGWAITV